MRAIYCQALKIFKSCKLVEDIIDKDNMGEIVGLCVGNYDFLLSKNTFNDSLSIFNKENLTIEKVFDDEIQTSEGIQTDMLI